MTARSASAPSSTAARRATRDSHVPRQGSHRGVTVARGECELLRHGAHQIPIGLARAQLEKLRAGIVRHERTAFARIRDEGMKHHLSGPCLHHPLVKAVDQVGARSGDALAGEHAESQIQQPIDIEVAAILDCIWASWPGTGNGMV